MRGDSEALLQAVRFLGMWDAIAVWECEGRSLLGMWECDRLMMRVLRWGDRFLGVCEGDRFLGVGVRSFFGV